VLEHAQTFEAVAGQHNIVTGVAQGNGENVLEPQVVVDNKDSTLIRWHIDVLTGSE